MTALLPLVDVPAANSPGNRRVAGFVDNGAIGVGIIPDGEKDGDLELRFEIGEAVHLAEKVLAGEQRAMTTPGLARILSATATLLFRVALEAGALGKPLPEDELDELEDLGNREDPAHLEHPNG